MVTLELDPVHLAAKLPTPFQADELLQGQGASNDQILQEAISMSLQLSQELGSTLGLEVRLHSNKLTVLSQPVGHPGSDPFFELPLLASHICLSQNRLAVAPATMGNLSDVWVLRIHSGDEAEIEKVMRSLAKLGAIRCDLPAMYVLGSKLSDGSMASIYRAQLHGVAEDPVESNVAIKVTPTLGTHQKRMTREMELHHACHNHPNVNKLIATFQVNEKSLGPSYAMAMPLPSQDLLDFVMNSSPSETMAANLIKGVLGALQHLHKQEIIYRKVSPENIFLTTDMRPVLSDFSLAMRLSDLKRFPIQLGHPGYTAPEILLNMEPTMQSDIFSAGGVLFFMVVKQQAFADAEVVTAVNNNVMRKIPLDHEEFKLYPKLKELVEGLMERSPLSRLDAATALMHESLQQVVPVPHAPPGDPNARSQRLRQRFVKMLPGDSPAPSVAEAEEGPSQEEIAKGSTLETDWRLSFSDSGRHEALVYRRRYLYSNGTTKSLLQIIPFAEIKDLQETSHTIWQTMELDGCLQVPLDGLDSTVEPYSPVMVPIEPAHVAASLVRPGADRVTTTMQMRLSPADLQSAMHRQPSNGSSKKLRIDSTSISPIRHPEEDSSARGQPSLWMQTQQAQLKADAKVSRDMFGTCAFSQSNEDGHRRRFVKKLGMGEQEVEEDFDDTASWQSWRSEAMLSSASRASRGRSGSMASCISNASAAAMRELLQASEDDSDREFDGLGPPAGHILSHRGSGLRGSSPHLNVPSESSRRQILSPTPPRDTARDAAQQRDWGTCQFSKEVGPGGRGRRMVRPVGPGQQQLVLPGEEDVKDVSWSSFAEIPRSLSQASVMSDMSFAVGPSPSGDMMKELLHADLSPADGPVRRRSSRRGTNHQLQDLYRLSPHD